jgi:hypothetical protein
MSVTIRRLAALLLLPSATAWAQGFPVNTNYPSAGGTLPDLTRLTVPSYEHYSQATTDGYAPTQQEYEGALALAAQQFAQIVTLNDLADVQEGLAAVQIVSGHVVGPTLFTLAFPPNWHRSERHPIYLSGAPTGYSNNYRVFPNGEAPIIAYAAARGFIVAYCNAGGVESQGISENVLRAVGTAMNELGTLGGDKQKIIAAGFSRGAATSVVWAANPLGLDYNVVAIFGHALPVSTIASVVTPYATYPMLGWLSDLITNDPARSTYGSPTPPHQFPNYELKILTNQDDNTEQRSALAVIEGLRGKQLLFSMGTHDPFLPLPDGVAFDRELSARNIPHASIVVYGEGHLLSLSVASEFFHAVDLIGAGQSYTVQAGRYIASQPDLTAHDYTRQRFENRTMLPFTAAVPFRRSRAAAAGGRVRHAGHAVSALRGGAGWPSGAGFLGSDPSRGVPQDPRRGPGGDRQLRLARGDRRRADGPQPQLDRRRQAHLEHRGRPTRAPLGDALTVARSPGLHRALLSSGQRSRGVSGDRGDARRGSPRQRQPRPRLRLDRCRARRDGRRSRRVRGAT